MKNCKILIVDDEKIKATLLTYYIKQNLNYTQIHCVENGRMAIQLMNTMKFDLVIMDWEMPEMDGLEATKIIKLDPTHIDCPVLMITGKYKSKENEEEAYDAGVDQFMTFPFQSTEFKKNISSLVNKQCLKQENRSRINHSLF